MAHKGAAKVLAEVISKGLGLNQEEEIGNWSESKNQGEYVMITLGGGHYAPRGNLVARTKNAWIGHMLANHSLHSSRMNRAILSGGCMGIVNK